MTQSINSYEKLRISHYHWLRGNRFYQAMDAFNLASQWSKGVRKDGFTPEIMHPIEVSAFLENFVDSLMYPEDTFTAALTHDLPEDHEAVTERQITHRYGDRVGTSVRLLNKKPGGAKRSTEEYYAAMADDAIASIVKGADRVRNVMTMHGVFSAEKQLEYMEETRNYALPMLKQARRNFPRQFGIYQNCKMSLVEHLRLLEAVHASKTKSR